MVEGHLEQNGELLLVAEGPWIKESQGDSRIGTFAVRASVLKDRVRRGMSISVAQLYHLVIPGLILTRHVFKGLRRPLYDDHFEKADERKLVYTRRAAVDYVVTRSRETGFREPLKVRPPAGKTFFVIVSPNEHQRELYPAVDGWIDHWNWTAEDSVLSEAPVNWIDRYDKKLFTRE